MATSGSTDYNETALELITAAYEDIGALDIEGTGPSAAEIALALVRLNRMLKAWQAKGLKLWRVREGRAFLANGTAEYLLPGANACDIDELFETTLDADEAAGQTVISVTKTTGTVAADVIGIVQSDNTIHWSTVASVVTDDTITIDTATTAAAVSGAKVYIYTNAAPRPLKIISARRLNGVLEIPMGTTGDDSGPMSREEYFNLPNKTAAGSPIQYYYDPKLSAGKLYLWPAPNSVSDMINYTYLDAIEDIDASSNTFDVPAEWTEMLSANLALRLAPSMGKTVPQEIMLIAQAGMEDLEVWDSEETGVYFYYAND